jgi:hypothetical protein
MHWARKSRRRLGRQTSRNSAAPVPQKAQQEHAGARHDEMQGEQPEDLGEVVQLRDGHWRRPPVRPADFLAVLSAARWREHPG